MCGDGLEAVGEAKQRIWSGTTEDWVPTEEVIGNGGMATWNPSLFEEGEDELEEQWDILFIIQGSDKSKTTRKQAIQYLTKMLLKKEVWKIIVGCAWCSPEISPLFVGNYYLSKLSLDFGKWRSFGKWNLVNDFQSLTWPLYIEGKFKGKRGISLDFEIQGLPPKTEKGQSPRGFESVN